MSQFNNKNFHKQTPIRFNYYSPGQHQSYVHPVNYLVNAPFTFNSPPVFKTISNLDHTTRTIQKQNKKELQFQPQKYDSTDKQNNNRQPNKKLSQSVMMKSNSLQNLLPLREIQLESRLSDLVDYANLDSGNFKKRVQTIQKQQYLMTNQNISIAHSSQNTNNKKTDRCQSKTQNMHFTFANLRPRLRKMQFKVSNTSINDFQVGQIIGKGSFGRVYRARHRSTGFFFAIKQMKKSGIKDMDQLILSIKGHFFLDHPNLAKLYSCFGDEEYLYLVMELCVDGSLAKYKKQIRSDEERDRIILGIARGIQYMHRYYLRHGDLKLQNILICHGFPKITDFDCIFNGKQKEFQEVRRRSKLWGSPAYFSPDMMKEHTFGLKDDIWSLGVIMYELYCNYHPFDLRDADDLTKIVSQQMIPIPKTVKASAKTLIQRMLDKNKQTRVTIEQILKYN